MNKKIAKTCICLLTGAMLCTMAGCGSTSGSYSKVEYETSVGYDSADYDGLYTLDNGTEVYKESSETEQEVTQSDKKIIYTADMNLETKDFASALNAIDTLVEKYGGYYSCRTIYDNDGEYQSASLTVRCPVDKYDTMLSEIGDAATVKQLTENAADVTEDYYSIETRLSTAKTKLERLQTLLAEADNVSDMITIEDAIAEAECEIDEYQGELNYMDSRINYSTITISLEEVKEIQTEIANPTFGERISESFSEGISAFGEAMADFVVWLAGAWLTLLFIGVIIAASIVIPITCTRRARRKREALSQKEEKIGKSENNKETAK